MLGAPLEPRDLLGDVVVENREILFGKRADKLAGGIFNRGHHAHQVDVYPDIGRLRASGERAAENRAKDEKPAAHCGPTPLPPRLLRRQSAPSSKWEPGA